MIDIEEQKKRFKYHVAKFYDCGNIKILDFQKPGSNYYRIRFLFEEDCYRLHISGDIGELTAKNATNMRYEKFAEDFSNNIGYFTQKIECNSRPIYAYDEEEARKQLIEMIRLNDLDVSKDWVERVLEDFDDEKGISNSGYEALEEVDSDAWEYAHKIGKVPTGILDLYMLAFKLAQEDLKRQEAERKQEPNKLTEETITAIWGVLIEHGQHDHQFHLGDTIKYTPDEVADILRQKFIGGEA